MIDFECPLCKKEVLEKDKVFLAEKDNLDSLDIEKESDKIFVHIACYKEFKSKK